GPRSSFSTSDVVNDLKRHSPERNVAGKHKVKIWFQTNGFSGSTTMVKRILVFYPDPQSTSTLFARHGSNSLKYSFSGIVTPTAPASSGSSSASSGSVAGNSGLSSAASSQGNDPSTGEGSGTSASDEQSNGAASIGSSASVQSQASSEPKDSGKTKILWVSVLIAALMAITASLIFVIARRRKMAR
ncbi:MAG: hypothetical protein ACYC5K_07235, partial [Saccharofermentanales bacterium]